MGSSVWGFLALPSHERFSERSSFVKGLSILYMANLQFIKLILLPIVVHKPEPTG